MSLILLLDTQCGCIPDCINEHIFAQEKYLENTWREDFFDLFVPEDKYLHVNQTDRERALKK